MKFFILLLLFGIEIFATDISYNRGETLFFSKGCSSCHGASAEGSTTYPKLANKEQVYLRQKLMDFKAGKAESVSQQMMAQFAQKLSAENIEDLSYFLSHHKTEEIEDVADDLLGGFGS